MSTKAEAAERARTDLGSADYEAWFREEVQRAVKEADDPAAKWLTNDEVKKLSARAPCAVACRTRPEDMIAHSLAGARYRNTICSTGLHCG